MRNLLSMLSLKKGLELNIENTYLIVIVALMLTVFQMVSCSTPHIQSLSHTTVLQPDEDDDIGGTFMESGDIRTIANKMTTSLLSSRALMQKEGMIRIAIAPIRNSTRFIIDKDIFTKRLKIELGKVADSRFRFFAQGLAQEIRGEILREQDKELWQFAVTDVATYIANSSIVTNASVPLRIAVIPVKNTNLIGLNADSFTALIRSRIAEKANGKIYFLAREENGKVISQILAESDLRNLGLVESARNNSIASVDYFLGGEFLSKSISPESAQMLNQATIGLSKDDPRTVEMSSSGTIKYPNAETYLNIMLIDAQTGEVPVEKMIRVEREMKSGLGKADYILTGELSALSKGAAGGNRSDYVILSFQLVDPQSNEVIWEDSYETKKVSHRSVIYK
jgi:PBP1b-binding outer membrane lipoprotein LpoB